MNLPRHEFSKENINDLLEFLKVAQNKKSNSFCNHNEYEKLKIIYPLVCSKFDICFNKFVIIYFQQKEINKLLNEYISATSIEIDLTIDTERMEITNEMQNISLTHISQDLLETDPHINQTAAEDVAYAIKESLSTEKCLPAIVINQLHTLTNLEDMFVSLSTELNFEEVTDFGKTLISTNIQSDQIITFYVKYILLPKVIL